MNIGLVIVIGLNALWFGAAWIASSFYSREPEFKGTIFSFWYIFGGVVFFLSGMAGTVLGVIQAFNEQEPAVALAALMRLIVACAGIALIVFLLRQYVPDKRTIEAGNYVGADVVDTLEYESRQVPTYHSKIDTGTTVRSSCPLVELPR